MREGGRGEGGRDRERERERDILPSWQVGCFSRPCQDSFALFDEDGLSMTVRYVAIIAPSCAWV